MLYLKNQRNPKLGNKWAKYEYNSVDLKQIKYLSILSKTDKNVKTLCKNIFIM